MIGCEYCQSYKAFNRRAAVPIQAYGAPSMPWEVVHVNLTGLTLPPTWKSNHFILVAKCALTRCVEIIPVKDKNEVTDSSIRPEIRVCEYELQPTIQDPMD